MSPENETPGPSPEHSTPDPETPGSSPERADLELLRLAEQLADDVDLETGAPSIETQRPELADDIAALRSLDSVFRKLRANEVAWNSVTILPSGPIAAAPRFHPHPIDATGRYTIDAEAGRGGMGVVYRARDLALDRTVAIKLVPPRLSSSTRHLSRLTQEARLLASLNHPNVATIHGLETTNDGERFLVLEWVEGETLAARLARGPLSRTEAIELGVQLADALTAAHEGRVVHLDLKPANLMITPQGRLKVLDFGLARRDTPSPERGDRGADTDKSSESSLGGTWGYVSPERLLEPGDHRADIFAFGCVLFECLTGRPAFAGSTVAEIQNRLLNGAPDWALLPSDARVDLQELIERCVEKRPDRRPESMASILRVLDGLRSETRRRLPSRSDPARNQLPRPRTPFIGRDEAVASCLGRLERPGLLTIVGIGGIGKSRLALAVATRWLEREQGPVYFADLTPLPNEPAELEAGIAALLGVRDRPNQTTLDGIAEALVESGTLLVLDNCEQASAALIGVITRVRETLPDLRVLVTSRIPFSGSDDEVLRLDPLSVPTDADLDDPERLRNNDAVRLFLHHIHRIRPALEILDSGLTSIGVISRRVGGLPLALELAAARTRVLGLHEIEERLDEQLNFLREGGPASGPRRTLGVTIEWSADQLSARERRLFQALSVFTPSCDLEGLSAVSPDPLDEFQILDVVAGLSQKSLLQVESVPGGASRYRLLEPIRQFASKELSETGEDEDVRRRHANHFLALAERAEVALYGASQAEWLERLERDRDNLALALSYWAEQGDGRLRAARMVAALYRFWTVRGHIQEGLKWTQRILSLPEDASLLLRARVTFAHAFLLFYAYGTNRDTLAARFEDALALFRNAGDRQGMARCLSALGIEFNSLGDHERGMHALTEAREHYAAVGDFRGLATVANNMGLSHWLRHDVAQATPLIEESYRLHAQSGDRQARANAALNLAFLIIRAVDLERGRVLVEECADILRNLEDQGTTRAGLLLCTAELATREGDSRAAVWFFGAADARLAEIDLELTDLDPWWYEHDLRYAEARMSLGAGDGAVVDVSVDPEVGADTHVNADAELGVDPEVGADNEADVLYEAGRDSRPEETVRQILTWLNSPESPFPPTTLR
ncbi:MAG: protein kinase [Candidatus Eisenbacteria bacterium]|nr:protein kinase [Candidatus Eisenbacteria bacterium]